MFVRLKRLRSISIEWKREQAHGLDGRTDRWRVKRQKKPVPMRVAVKLRILREFTVIQFGEIPTRY